METLLRDGLVLVHPFVFGELALGRLKKRSEILGLLGAMPEADEANHEEVLEFIDRHELAGSGVGWIDAHLLVSAALGGISLWTLARRLANAAERLALSA